MSWPETAKATDAGRQLIGGVSDGQLPLSPPIRFANARTAEVDNNLVEALWESANLRIKESITGLSRAGAPVWTRRKARRGVARRALALKVRLLDDEGGVHPEQVVRGLVADEDVVTRHEIERERLGLGRVEVAALALAPILGHLSGLVRVRRDLVRCHICLEHHHLVDHGAAVLHVEGDLAARHR